MGAETAKTTFADMLNELVVGKKAEAAASETTPIAGDPENAPAQADSIDQAKKGGSTADTADTTPAEQPKTDSSPDTQEIGEDPSKAPDVKVTKTEGTKAAEAPAGSQGPTLIKQAEALESMADDVDTNIHAMIANAVFSKHRAAAIHKAAGEMVEELGMAPEDAEAAATAVADGDLDEAELQDAVEQNKMVEELAASTGSTPEEILETAAVIGEFAEANEIPVEDIAANAVQLQKKAAAEAYLDDAKRRYNEAGVQLKKAEAEGDEFGAELARMRRIEIKKTTMQHLAMDDEGVVDLAELEDAAGVVDSAGLLPSEVTATDVVDTTDAGTPEDKPKDDDKPKDGDTPKDDDKPKDSEAPEDTTPSGDAEPGEGEDITAVMMGAGVPADEAAVAIEALNELSDKGIDAETLNQVMANELTPGAVPALMKTAQAEGVDIDNDPLLISHAYIRARLQAHRAKAQDQD